MTTTEQQIITRRRVQRDYCFTFCTCFEDRHCLKFCQCGSCDVKSCKCDTCQARGPVSKSDSLSLERQNIDSEFARTESSSTRTSSCSISQPIHILGKPIYQNAFYQTVEQPVPPAAVTAGPRKVVELSSSESSASSTCPRCSKCNKKQRGASTSTCSQECEKVSCPWCSKCNKKQRGASTSTCRQEGEKVSFPWCSKCNKKQRGASTSTCSQGCEKTISQSCDRSNSEVSPQVALQMTNANEKTWTLSSVSVRSQETSTYQEPSRCLSSVSVRSQETSTYKEPSRCLSSFSVSSQETSANKERSKSLSSVSVTSQETSANQEPSKSLSSVSVTSQETSYNQEPPKTVTLDKSTQCRPNSIDIAIQLHSPTVASQTTSITSSQSDSKCNCCSRQSSEFKDPTSISHDFVSKKQQSAFRISDAANELGSRSSSYGHVEMLINVKDMKAKSRPKSKPAPRPSRSPRTPEEPLHLSIQLRSNHSERQSRSSRSPRSLAAYEEEIFTVRRRQLDQGFYTPCHRNKYYREYAH